MSKKDEILQDPREWVKDLEMDSTEDIAVPKMLIDQVIGQKHGVEIIRKAAEQRRHVMLIGDPGTGKSMLARSISELLPKEELQDVLVYNNHEDNNEPRVRVVPAGKGKEIVQVQKAVRARCGILIDLVELVFGQPVALLFPYCLQFFLVVDLEENVCRHVGAEGGVDRSVLLRIDDDRSQPGARLRQPFR